MTSLSYVTEHIKLVGKWAGIGIVGIIALVFLFRIAIFVKNIVAPPKIPPPTITWGKLPAISFPESDYLDTFIYSVNTLSGELPRFPDRMMVNLIATPEASLQSLSNAKELTGNAGFNQEEVRISESTYQWINPDPPQQKMQYNIISKNFMLTSNYLFDQDIITAKNLPDDVTAQKNAEDFFANFNAFPGDFEATKSAVTFLTIQNGTLAKTTSLSNAQIIRVDFFQKDVNGYPIFYPKYQQGITYALIGDSNTVVEAIYAHHVISDVTSTYPIMTADQALEVLKKGKGYIVHHTGGNTKISVQNVHLGYYLDDQEHTYLRPIYIFEGADDFIAYVSAISPSWINN